LNAVSLASTPVTIILVMVRLSGVEVIEVTAADPVVRDPGCHDVQFRNYKGAHAPAKR
jgi:hypothetical protein